MRHRRAGAQLRVIAELNGRSLAEIHRLSRLPESPSPFDCPAGVYVYHLCEWAEFLASGTYKRVEAPSDAAGQD